MTTIIAHINIPKNIKKTQKCFETYVMQIFSQFGNITNITGCEYPKSKKPITIFITYTTLNENAASIFSTNKFCNNILSTYILHELKPKKPLQKICKNTIKKN